MADVLVVLVGSNHVTDVLETIVFEGCLCWPKTATLEHGRRAASHKSHHRRYSASTAYCESNVRRNMDLHLTIQEFQAWFHRTWFHRLYQLIPTDTSRCEICKPARRARP